MPTPVTSWEQEVISLLEGLGGTGGSGNTGGASEATLDEVRTLLQAVKDAIAPAARPTPSFVIVGVGLGTIPAGAKYASFSIPPGGSGTITGTSYTDEAQEISFPALSSGYAAINYEVTAGSLYITYAI